MALKTPQEIIDQAIKENQFSERLIYGFAILLFCTGLLLMIVSVLSGNPFIGVIGVIASGLFIPAVQSTRQIRQENMCIRLLEIAINQAETSADAADALRIVFIDTFVQKNTNIQSKDDVKKII